MSADPVRHAPSDVRVLRRGRYRTGSRLGPSLAAEDQGVPLAVPMVLLLLHDGVDERRSLRLTPLLGEGSVLVDIHHRGAGPLGGPRPGESPLLEVEHGELVRLDALLESARRGRVSFDTVDDRNDPSRRFLRARGDPQDGCLVLRIVDTREGRSMRGDWGDGRGVVRVPSWEWTRARAALGAFTDGDEEDHRVIPLESRSRRRGMAPRVAQRPQSAALRRGRGA